MRVSKPKQEAAKIKDGICGERRLSGEHAYLRPLIPWTMALCAGMRELRLAPQHSR